MKMKRVLVAILCLSMKDYREQLKARDIKVSYTDLLVKFVAKALTEFPLLNCSVEDNKIIYKHYVNMPSPHADALETDVDGLLQHLARLALP